VCCDSTRVTTVGDELFVVVDRRPLGHLAINVYDTSEKLEQRRAVDEAPADPDPIGPDVLMPTVQGTGHVDDDDIFEWTNSRFAPSKSIGLPGSRSLSLSDLAKAADEEEEGEGEVEAVDWLSNLDRGCVIADVVRCLTLSTSVVDNSMTIDIIKVTL